MNALHKPLRILSLLAFLALAAATPLGATTGAASNEVECDDGTIADYANGEVCCDDGGTTTSVDEADCCGGDGGTVFDSSTEECCEDGTVAANGTQVCCRDIGDDDSFPDYTAETTATDAGDCCGDVLITSTVGCCGGSEYFFDQGQYTMDCCNDTDTYITSPSDEAQECCDDGPTQPFSDEVCCDDGETTTAVAEADCCASGTYDSSTEACCDDDGTLTVVPLDECCGGDGGETWDSSTEACCNDNGTLTVVALDECCGGDGGETWDSSSEACCNDNGTLTVVALDECCGGDGGTVFDSSTEECCGDGIVAGSGETCCDTDGDGKTDAGDGDACCDGNNDGVENHFYDNGVNQCCEDDSIANEGETCCSLFDLDGNHGESSATNENNCCDGFKLRWAECCDDVFYSLLGYGGTSLGVRDACVEAIPTEDSIPAKALRDNFWLGMNKSPYAGGSGTADHWEMANLGGTAALINHSDIGDELARTGDEYNAAVLRCNTAPICELLTEGFLD